MKKYFLTLLYLLLVFNGCANQDEMDQLEEGDVVTGDVHWRFTYLNASWSNCVWEELVEYVDINGIEIKQIYRYKSDLISGKHERCMLDTCRLYINDVEISDFELLCPKYIGMENYTTPLSVYLRHRPTKKEIAIYSFDNWDHIDEIKYSVVKTNNSYAYLADILCINEVGEYMQLCDWARLDDWTYWGNGYRTPQGYLRCGLIGDLCGEYPRLHLVSDDAPQNARYTLLGILYIDRLDMPNSIYLNPDYETLTEGAEYAVTPDESWPDMRYPCTIWR